MFDFGELASRLIEAATESEARAAFEKSLLADAAKAIRNLENRVRDLEQEKAFAPRCRLGDKIIYCDHEFTVQHVEMIQGVFEKYGFLYRCGNEGTEDYCAFYDSEIGDMVQLKSRRPFDCRPQKRTEVA